MGDASCGARTARFYTHIGIGHRTGIDVTTYPTDIFARLPTELDHTVHRLTPKM